MKTILYGNGAMAKVIYSYAKHSLDIAGFTVDDICIGQEANNYLGMPLVPFSEVEHHFPPGEYQMLIAMGFIGMNALRQQKAMEAQQKGYGFTHYHHPNFHRHDGVEIGENTVILDCVSIHPGSIVGAGTFISSNTNIGHDCIIGEFSWINAGVSLAGGCEVGAGSFFGVNASAGHGLSIGLRNFIAANTYIGKSTEDDQVFLSESAQLFKLKSAAFLKFSGVI